MSPRYHCTGIKVVFRTISRKCATLFHICSLSCLVCSHIATYYSCGVECGREIRNVLF